MNISDTHTPLEILLVEDNENDVILAKRAFQSAGLPSNISVARDGVEAMEFLRKQGQFSAAPNPDIILLDLNLPRKNGREVLKEIKEDSALKCIPVILLTSSTEEKDVAAAYGSLTCPPKDKQEWVEKFTQVLSKILK